MEKLLSSAATPNLFKTFKNGREIVWYVRVLHWVDDVKHPLIPVELRGRDAADCALRDCIRRHTIIDDNPTSG